MKLSVKDFQIIKQANLEFRPGLTVLVGPSNNGKSSIVKALKAATYTESGTTPVRHGANAYIVGVSHNDNVVLFKKGATSKYVVNGKEFSKFGVNTPEEVSNALNMKELVLNGSKVQLNFWDQMDKPFLLDKSAGDLFKFILDSGENDKLSSVLKTMVSDRQQINRDADVVQGSILSTDSMIKEQQDIIDKLEPQVQEANKIINCKNKYDDYLEIKDLSSKIINNNNELETILKEKIEIDKKLSNQIDIDKLLDNLSRISNIDNIVTNLTSVTTQRDKNIYDSKAINTALEILNRINFNEIEILNTSKNKYDIILNEIKQVLELNLVIPDITKLQKIEDISNIQNIINQIDALESNIEETENVKDNVTSSLDFLDSIQKHIKTCPVCGQEIGGNLDVHSDVC